MRPARFIRAVAVSRSTALSRDRELVVHAGCALMHASIDGTRFTCEMGTSDGRPPKRGEGARGKGPGKSK